MEIGFLLVDFDVRSGPVISISDGSIALSEEQADLIKLSVFPESASPLPQSRSHVYTFKVGDLFCYCSYNVEESQISDRGYILYSFVIITKCAYYPLWQQLLESADSLENNSKNQKFELICNFANKWINVIKSNESTDLPLFNGTVEYIAESSTSTLELIGNGSFYKANNYYISNSISQALGYQYLHKNHRTSDLVALWEGIMLDVPILVIGSTPRIVSEAVFAIASLKFPEICPNIYPYISITDKRFVNLANNPVGIVGTSNPLASVIAHKFPLVFQVGFSNENGVVKPVNPKSNIQSFNEKTIRPFFFSNTERARISLCETIDDMLSHNFVDVLLGVYNVSFLEKHIKQRNVISTMSHSSFAKKIIKTVFSRTVRISKICSTSTVQRINEFDLNSVFKSLKPEELDKAKQKYTKAFSLYAENQEMKRALKNHMRLIQLVK